MSDNKVKLSEKFAYALGDAAAGGIVWKVMSIAFPLFFTNIFGLSFADAAMLMLVARLFDVVTDPIMGSLADRTRSRWGTYRPWLIFGAIPLGLVFAPLAIAAFYVLYMESADGRWVHNQSMLWCAAVSILSQYFCKPTEKKIYLEMNDVREEDYNPDMDK